MIVLGHGYAVAFSFDTIVRCSSAPRSAAQRASRAGRARAARRCTWCSTHRGFRGGPGLCGLHAGTRPGVFARMSAVPASQVFLPFRPHQG